MKETHMKRTWSPFASTDLPRGVSAIAGSARAPFGIVVAALVAVGCVEAETPVAEPAPTQTASQAATLELRPGGADPETVSVVLQFARAPERAAPRMMEVFIEPSAGLSFVDAEAGTATVKAGKGLVVAVQPDGAVRVLVFSTANLATLDSGPLARLRFKKTGARASVTLRNKRPVFAPPGADLGITLGAPLTLGGN